MLLKTKETCLAHDAEKYEQLCKILSKPSAEIIVVESPD
jgi:hypothetical protein